MTKAAPPSLVKKAKQLDSKLRACWASIKRSRRAFGEIVNQMEREELHKYVAKPGSRKGYPSLWEYVEALTDGEVSRAQMYISMKVATLTEGPNAMTPDEVDALPAGNAYALAKLPAEKRTPEIVKKAKTQPRNKFMVTAQAVRNESLPPEKQKAPAGVDFYRKLHPTVAEKLEDTIARFRKHPVIRDGDLAMSLEDKAIFAMCCAAETHCQDELKAAEEAERRGLATITEEDEETTTEETSPAEQEILEEVRAADFTAPDFPHAVATAETEHRVVSIKGRHVQ